MVQDSKSNEWFTPRFVLEWVGPIGLDPCYSPLSAVVAAATNDVRAGVCGLELDWHGDGLVYCNMPYSDCARWVRKCAQEHERHGRLVVALLPAKPGEGYWHRWVWGRARWIAFIDGRLRFDTATGPAVDVATFGSALVCWGDENAANKLLTEMRLRAASTSERAFFAVSARNQVEGAAVSAQEYIRLHTSAPFLPERSEWPPQRIW